MTALREAIFGHVPSELLSVVSLVAILWSGALWGHGGASWPRLLATWLAFVWWQRLLASGGLTWTIAPTLARSVAPLSGRAATHNNRIVVVTGASSGIGYATAQALLQLGFVVVVTARTAAVGASVVRRLQADAGLREDAVFVLRRYLCRSLEAARADVKRR